MKVDVRKSSVEEVTVTVPIGTGKDDIMTVSASIVDGNCVDVLINKTGMMGQYIKVPASALSDLAQALREVWGRLKPDPQRQTGPKEGPYR